MSQKSKTPKSKNACTVTKVNSKSKWIIVGIAVAGVFAGFLINYIYGWILATYF